MRPSRIIVGEVRAEECLDLLLALNAGLPGMCTLHANSAREALVKMCTLPLLAGENISARFVVPTVAASVDLVVHLGIDHARRAPGQRDRRRAGPGRERRHRGRADLRAPRRRAAAHAAGCRRGRAVTSGVGIDVHRTPEREPADDGCAGRARGRASGCCWSGRRSRLPRPHRGRRAAAPAARRELLARAGLGAVSSVGVRRCCCAAPCGAVGRVSRSRSSRARRRWRSRSALMGGVPPGRGGRRPGAAPAARARRGVAGGGRQPRLRRPGRHVAARRARRARPSAGPSRCASAFDAFALDYQVTGRFGDCLDRLKDAARRPGRRPGGRGAAGRARGRRRRARPAAAQPVRLPARRPPHPLRARVAPGLDGQRRPARGRRAVAGAAADVRSSPRSSPATRSPAGVVVLRRRRRVCVVAYRLMMRIGRLPVERRILS